MKITKIKKAPEFSEARARGRKWRGELLSFYFFKKKAPAKLSVGTIATKKLARNATQRNYIKRKVYEFLRVNSGKKLEGTTVVARLSVEIKDIKVRALKEGIQKDLKGFLKQVNIAGGQQEE